MSYDQISQMLRKLESRFGWQPMIEAGNIIGVQLDGQSVTLEPGGQFELSGAPVMTIHQTCAEVNSHLYQVGPATRMLCAGLSECFLHHHVTHVRRLCTACVLHAHVALGVHHFMRMKSATLAYLVPPACT